MPMTIKSKFRMGTGYDTYHRCKDCKFCINLQCGAHSHYKCRKMGITGSAATEETEVAVYRMCVKLLVHY